MTLQQSSFPEAGLLEARAGVDINEFGVRVKRHMGWDAYLEKLAAKDQSADGREMPDPVPMEPPLGFVRQPTMVDHIRNMIRSEHLRRAVVEAGNETFEESDDFDVDDPVDAEPASAYEFEEVFEPATVPRPTEMVSGEALAGATPGPGVSGAPAVPAAPAGPTVQST